VRAGRGLGACAGRHGAVIWARRAEHRSHTATLRGVTAGEQGHGTIGACLEGLELITYLSCRLAPLIHIIHISAVPCTSELLPHCIFHPLVCRSTFGQILTYLGRSLRGLGMLRAAYLSATDYSRDDLPPLNFIALYHARPRLREDTVLDRCVTVCTRDACLIAWVICGTPAVASTPSRVRPPCALRRRLCRVCLGHAAPLRACRSRTFSLEHHHLLVSSSDATNHLLRYHAHL